MAKLERKIRHVIKQLRETSHRITIGNHLSKIQKLYKKKNLSLKY